MTRLVAALLLGLSAALPALHALAQTEQPATNESPVAKQGEPAPTSPPAEPPKKARPPQDPGFSSDPPAPGTWAEQPGFQETGPRPTIPAPSAGPGQADTRPGVTPEAVTLEAEPEFPPDYRASSFKIHNALSSSTGLHRVVSADSGAPGTFRLSLLSSFFSGTGVHCDSERPCTNELDVDAVRSTAARLSLSTTLLPYFEGSLALHTRATSNSLGRPELLQILGDAALGAKVFTPYELDSVLSFGGLAELWLLNGGGSVGLDLMGTSLGLTGLATADFTRRRNRSERRPWRAHVNAGYFFNNSSELVSDIERERDAPISRIERFGLGIQRVDSLRFGLGGEFVHDVVRPFVEWSLDVPINRQGYVCDRRRADEAGEGCLVTEGNFGTTPSRLGLGARVFPWPKHGLALTVGVDIGTGATTSFLEETTPELPWVVHLGLGYAVDTAPPAPIVQPIPAARLVFPPPEYYLSGVVLDSTTLAPLPDAILRFEDPMLTGMLTSPDGSFRSASLKPGSYRLNVSKAGYRPGLCMARVPAIEPSTSPTPDATTPPRGMVIVGCPLDPLPRVGNVVGAVVEAGSALPVAAATVRITDKLGRRLDLTADTSGAFRFENVPPGFVRLTASAPGYLPGFIELESAAHSDVAARLPLSRRPAPPNATFVGQAVKLKKPVTFTPGSDAILAESHAILAEVADLLLAQQPGTVIEIRGHTDDSGTDVESLALSQRRADAVRQHLVQLGVDDAVLVARGYGRTRPLVPSVSEVSRAKNQRIEFGILPAAPTPPGAAPPGAPPPGAAPSPPASTLTPF